ncbi:MAG: DNA double-strand break repair nuclease NurA, partial [Candidatus Promineifilaceae bacterium]|nr:DNA double-strand break repair nuclease NurA [Candidatus Promineifilaceae bacterium]
YYRSARPLDDAQPLDAAIPAPPPPETATVVASDGSQILPDRHAPYLYSLVNVGIITYFHGRGRPPRQETHPALDYPGGDEDNPDEETFVDSGAIVNLRRDLAEIQRLVETAAQVGNEPHPVLALLDQRLLYWPVGSAGNEEGQRVLYGWQKAMSKAAADRSLLAGYIDRPGKRSVMTLLYTLDLLDGALDAETLMERSRQPGLTDAHLFRQILREPGQRSKVFVDVSQHNGDFHARDERNEVCFFYFNSGRRHIARVDVPIWVAKDAKRLEAVHGLIDSQCQIMGDYPYVLARADELAVVGYNDRESLDVMIANAMNRQGLAGRATAKRSGKDVARAGRTRHEGLQRRGGR